MTMCERPKSTMIQPFEFEAHWRALSNGTGARRPQAFLRHVAMKNWPFEGRKKGRRGRKWPKFRWRYRWNHDDEIYQLVVALYWRDNQQIINFNENIDDSLGKPRYTVTIINVNALFTTASLRAKALRSVICNMQCNNIHYCQSTYHHYLPHFVRRRRPAVVVLVGTSAALLCWYCLC